MKLTLRTYLFIGFIFVAIIPVSLLSWWIQDSALSQEYNAVEEKHLLVAKNLTNALSRYALDTQEVFRVAHREIRNGRAAPSEELAALFNSLHIWRICTLSANGDTSTYYAKNPELKKLTLTQEQKMLAEKVPAGHTQFLPVTLNQQNHPVLTLVYRTNEGDLVIGEVSTDYFVKLQKSITFGELGHAAIVDHAGNVLGHPKQEWVDTAKNISKIAPVQAMMSGEQGVSYFYSPAIKADMVAGYSYVPETGWGAMIPQPVSELKEHANAATRVALAIGALGIFLALLLAWILSGLVANPISRVASVSRRIAGDENYDGDQTLTPSSGPTEAVDLITSFNLMVDRIKSKTDELTYLAEHDPLTKLPNRSLLKRALSNAIAETEKNGTSFHLLFLDLDEFKEVNDNLGHNFGDIMLQEVAERLNDQIGNNGVISRLGGDEFAVVLPPTFSTTEVLELSQHLIDAVRRPFNIDEHEIYISTSIGIANCPRDGNDINNLLRCADLAMYAAKSSPDANYCEYSDQLHTVLNRRKTLETELRQALDRQEFALHYQPRVDGRTGDIKGFEALVRWHHPQRNLMWPKDFIDATERSREIIIRLGEWVIEQACKDQKRFEAAGHKNVNISINLSERQFHAPDLIERIDEIFKRNQANPRNFEFEVTESLAMQRPAKVAQLLQQLRDRGFQLSIDDFGTGYSSLERLKQLPIDKIKIDKSFCQGIGLDQRDSAIVSHILKLAVGLNMGVVAEGIETQGQLSFLQDEDCGEIQGFLYSKAVPWDNALGLLSHQPLAPSELVG